MGAPDLIFELRRNGYSIQADGGYLDISPADNLSPELVQQLRKSKAEILIELQQEARREKVITMLEITPDAQWAIYTDAESDPHNVIVTVAVRACQQTCELQPIPKAKYDAWRLLDLIEQYGQVTHSGRDIKNVMRLSIGEK